MKRNAPATFVSRSLALTLVLAAASHAQPKDPNTPYPNTPYPNTPYPNTPYPNTPYPNTPYPNMAPLGEYLMERDAEIALARTAAPPSISQDAEVMVIGKHGYETAVQGKNGFVCVVERSWTAGANDPDFWNPKLRGPICFNPPAARSYLPLTIKKTELILAGRTKAQMFEEIKAGIDKKELPTPETGAMCYMMSKQQYLGDEPQHWHPHLMFFLPLTDAAAWGANLPGSPMIASPVPAEKLTVFLVPIGHWSDGTAAPPMN
jgi:hypothetical protein